MLVERGIQVMNFEVVGDAYAIASNYLRKTGAIADTFATDERLLEIIVKMFQHGEFNRTPARQQGDRRIRSAHTGLTASPASRNSGEIHGSRDRPHHADL